MALLDGKVAVVTGAAAGLGKGFALALAQEGADVAICDIQPKVEGVAHSIEAETGRRVPWWLADVTKPDDVRRFIDGTVHQLGGIDILVNNAGVWRATNPLEDTWEQAVAQWDLIHGTNLKGVFLVGRRAIPHIVARGGGHIVNIATDHITPPPGFATGGGTRMDTYDSSKWGVNGLTQGWAKFLRPHGVRVNALCMDATDSEMVRFAAGAAATPEVVAQWMTPAQIAGLMLDLIREGPEGRTGENIGIWMKHEIALPERREELPSRHR
jgi:NAD(P)-dependent dehydrogenase (short-subunit alcohol dehydrogenase family)